MNHKCIECGNDKPIYINNMCEECWGEMFKEGEKEDGSDCS